MTFQDTFQAYMLQLAADGRSGHTINQYRRHLASFANWLDETNRPTEIRDIGHQDLAAFLASENATHDAAGKKKRPTSVNTIRSSLKTFFCFVHAAGYAPRNAGRLIRRAICGDPPPRGLSDDEVNRLLKVLDTATTGAERRDRMLFRLLLRTGLRIGSALNLEVEDLDLDHSEIRLRTAKGSRDEVVFIPAEITLELREFVAERSVGPVFIGGKGNRFGVRSAQRRFATWVEQAGINRTASPHALRHTFATRLLAKTGNLALVQAGLRHRSISSTTIYARANEERLRSSI
ncbi:MAG: tyrosine-type recombinase/integrase [Planctomycetota bacterium]